MVRADDASAPQPSDLVVLEYLRSRGYNKAAAALESSFAPNTSAPLPPTHNASNLLNLNTAGYSLDYSTDVVFWGLTQGDPDRLTASFSHFMSLLLSYTPPSLPSTPPPPPTLLLQPAFIAFAHVYTCLLSLSFTTHAASLLTTYSPYFTPHYATELVSLEVCNTPALLSQQTKELAAAQDLRQKLVSKRKRRNSNLQDIKNATLMPDQPSADFQRAKTQHINTLQTAAAALKSEDDDLLQSLGETTAKLQALPFLSRLRTMRAYIELSSLAYAHLTTVLQDPALAPISSILYTRCIVQVSSNDLSSASSPPPIVLEDQIFLDGQTLAPDGTVRNLAPINWAAPFPPRLRNLLHPAPSDTAPLPFPDFQDAGFNENLLTLGFRKLAALERAADAAAYSPDDTVNRLHVATPGPPAYKQKGAAFSPHVCLAAVAGSPICIGGERPGRRGEGPSVSCVKVSPLDGSKIAAGGSDGAVRIFHMSDAADGDTRGASAVPSVLIGHKGGLPVHAVDWFRDQRTLMSAGGDGTVRLWDANMSGAGGKYENNLDSASDGRGAALAVYKGHVGRTAVYDCAVAPSGYYFASCGADFSARLWCTDREEPVRLFVGHVGEVNAVSWHPNCSYLATGGGDRTVRLWDVQSGKAVRLLSGVGGAITNIAFCPTGKNLAAADDRGVVTVFDLGTGKKVKELRETKDEMENVHSVSYSMCGSCLATGTDRGVSLYDVRGEENEAREAVRKLPCNDVNVLDLVWTKANVVLAGGIV